jgi:hypothetical protein
MAEPMGRTEAKTGKFPVDQNAAAYENPICGKLTVLLYRVKIHETLM